MSANTALSVTRTSLSVSRNGVARIEVIEGPIFPWRFRPHFHVGDEVVMVLAGRARLVMGNTRRQVEAGETVLVPARAMHRFEPLDGQGWAFTSRFVPSVDGPSSAPLPAPGAAALVVQALTMLAHRPTLQTDVGQVARACAVSAGHLARSVRREIGTSLHNVHVLMALHKAKGLLKHGAPVVEAALESGFYDQAHLNREFVRTFGMTPGAFRSAWMAMEADHRG